ncbi:MAG: hypothetical protein KU37_07355 [Sulfuricurvum sp. PC08-66]|nr:MAG: hypothetical protein KU37_07355 [Sulfuricurvum sp. PC08-66]
METTTYWFIPKFVGWGFLPVTWQGWLATLLLLAVILLSAYVNGVLAHQNDRSLKRLLSKPFLRFLLDLVVYIALFTLLFADKVEGGLQWRFF